MKVTVERAQLLKSLGHVHRVVERRNTIPILGKRAASRRERPAVAESHRPRPRGDGDAAGGIRNHRVDHPLPAHMFYDIVRKLPDGAQIVLEGDGDRSVLAIRAGRSRFTLQRCRQTISPISPPAT